jgi:hypothetical protein
MPQNSKNPLLSLLQSSLPHTQQHQDAAIAAAAAEGARMAGVQMTPPKMESTRRRYVIISSFAYIRYCNISLAFILFFWEEKMPEKSCEKKIKSSTITKISIDQSAAINQMIQDSCIRSINEFKSSYDILVNENINKTLLNYSTIGRFHNQY